MSELLKKSREYESEFEQTISEEEKPFFHLAPRIGWMNDPNGFSYYNGEYHLFYQYHPYDTVWGPMHWGHSTSKDLIHWMDLPAAIAPDESFDKDGCFSGSAIELGDGKQLLMYTGVKKIADNEGNISEFQTQCVAIGDGRDYIKNKNNPVIDSDMLPEGVSKVDFRDPKIWMEDDTFYCVVASRTEDWDGQLLLFSSEDAVSWKFEKILVKNNHRFGTMWECPDYFELDGKKIVITSPMEMLTEGYEFTNGNGTLCLIGHSTEDGTFEYENFQSVDYGIDFYAPQTMLSKDGRRIMIAWMQNWDTISYRSKDTKWFGQMTLPRELSVRAGKLIQQPVREIESLYGEKIEKSNVIINKNCEIEGINGRLLDMTVRIRPADDGFEKFEIRVAENDLLYTSISYDAINSLVEMDRRHCGCRKAVVNTSCCKVRDNDREVTLRIIMDRYSIEIFVNDGEQVMSMAIFTDLDADKISFSAKGQAFADVCMHRLEEKNR